MQCSKQRSIPKSEEIREETENKEQSTTNGDISLNYPPKPNKNEETNKEENPKPKRKYRRKRTLLEGQKNKEEDQEKEKMLNTSTSNENFKLKAPSHSTIIFQRRLKMLEAALKQNKEYKHFLEKSLNPTLQNKLLNPNWEDVPPFENNKSDKELKKLLDNISYNNPNILHLFNKNITSSFLPHWGPERFKILPSKKNYKSTLSTMMKSKKLYK